MAYELRISDWSSDVCSSDLLASRNGQVARGFRAAGQHDRVELRLQRFGGVYGQPVFGVFCRAHIGGWTELDAFCLHLRKTAVDMGLFQLEVGNAITQQAADAVVLFEYGYREIGRAHV